MPMIKRESKKGFTLIELLVVIAIIAILSAIGLVVFSGAQKSGRIAKRIQDLKAIQTALEIYYSVNKSYPTTSGSGRSECATWGSHPPENVIPGLTPTYMIAFPADPSMDKSASTSCYLYLSNGVDYKILDHTISGFTSADYQNQRNLIDPNRDGGVNGCIVDGTAPWAWAIYSSPTSACW